MAPEAQQESAGAVPQAPWHALAAGQVLARLESSPQGLSSDEAARRLRQFGPNRLKAAPPASTLLLLVEEFHSPLVLVLIAAALLLFLVAALGHQPEQNVDAALILAIVLVNGGLGFVQNYRAQRGIEALQRLSAPVAAFPAGRPPAQRRGITTGARRRGAAGRGRPGTRRWAPH